MRLDKLLGELNIGTRSEVKKLITKGRISVNGSIVTKPDEKVDEESALITYEGREYRYKKFSFYMLNKPEGILTANTDSDTPTIMDLLPKELRNTHFSIGRLDKDTTGLIIVCNDGELVHRLLSPKKHVDKKYLVTIEKPLNDTDIKTLENGVDIGEKNLTAQSKVEIIDENNIYLTIHEGKFHQIKRMLKAVDNNVLALKRISLGGVSLDRNLQSGQYRELTDQEIKTLYEN
ncbi:MAG: rRNA pseudouridine synthase [Acetatifactor sp.]|nr:rRNA pseudouridine synthase [Acetatifactor sp.]